MIGDGLHLVKGGTLMIPSNGYLLVNDTRNTYLYIDKNNYLGEKKKSVIKPGSQFHIGTTDLSGLSCCKEDGTDCQDLSDLKVVGNKLLAEDLSDPGALRDHDGLLGPKL